MKTVDSIVSEAVLLPKDQRLTVAHRILASVEPEANAQIEQEWDDEIRERIRQYDSDPGCAVPGAKVFAELDEKLKR